MLDVAAELRIPLAELHFTFARSGGPGGQNVNKVNTKAVLRWSIVDSPSLTEPQRQRIRERLGRRVTLSGDVLVTSQRFRDAGRNVTDCLEKLRALVAEALRTQRPRRPTRPTRGSVRRRLDEKKKRSHTKRLRRSDGD